MTLSNQRLRYVLLALVAVLIAAGAYAFTASNTVPASNAGSGSGNITGYTVSGIAYTLGATPTDLAAVSFTLDKSAGTVKVQVQSGGPWYACTVTGGTSVSCDTTVGTQATVQPSDSLTVVATS